MDEPETINFFHAPQTRSAGTRVLLEELGAPYTLHVLNMKAGEQRQPAYLDINPLGKVPAILHRGAVVTEQVAIFIYLADLFPQAGLAPALDSPLRGPYLRWLVFYAACYEPGLIDCALKREPGPAAMSPYGSFDTVLGALKTELSQGPFLLGKKISAADILWGHALRWGLMFNLIPADDILTSYVASIAQRPAALKVHAADAALATEHAKVLQ